MADLVGSVPEHQETTGWWADVPKWGKQRAYSWWLEHRLDALLADLAETYLANESGIAQFAPEMVAALRMVREVHRPKRLDRSIGCGATCPACSTGIVSHHDDGPSTHRVEWPCPTIIVVAVALGIGPPDEHPWCYLLERLSAAHREART